MRQPDVAIDMKDARLAPESAPNSTTGVSRYVNIASLPTTQLNTSSSRRGLPILQARMPKTHSGSPRAYAVDETGSTDVRDSSLILTGSYHTDENTQKFVRALLEELGVEQDMASATLCSMPPPPIREEPQELDESPLGDPAHAPSGLFHRRHIGLLISLVVASLMTSCLKRGVLPIMKGELQMAEYQADAAEILVMLPWSCMFLIGFVSDCFSMFGTHRKSYIVLGWTLVVVALFVFAVVTQAHAHDAARGVGKSSAYVTSAVFLLGVACFGGILTVGMAEFYFVAMSKRERLLERGEVIGTMLLVQFLCESIGQALTNYVVFQPTSVGIRPLYNLRRMVLFLALCALVPLAATIFLFDEDTELMRKGATPETETPVSPRIMDKIKDHMRLVWTTLQRESTWSVVRFLLFFVFFSEFFIRYAHLVLDEIVGVNPIDVSTGKVINELLAFTAVFVWRLFLLNVDWKWFALLSFLFFAWFPQFLYSFFVLRNISRNVGLYILTGSTKSFIRGLIVALEVAMAVEIAPRGAEGATVGVVMSIASVMRLLATTLSNGLSYAFASQKIAAEGLRVKLSTSEEIEVERNPAAIKLPVTLERHVLLALLLCYTIKLLACGGVAFIPHQKMHLQWLHRFGRSSPRYALATIVILGVSLLIAAIFNSLVVMPRTSCLKAFGGTGCVKHG